MNLIPILVCLLLSGAYGTIPVVTVDSENKAIVHRELFEADLQTFSGPSYFWVTLGSSRAGKSTLMNTFVRLAQQKSAPEHRSDTEIKPFGVCHALMPCTTGMSGYGVQRQSGGVDFFIDTPGGDMFEGSKAVTHVLAIGASMASTSIAFVDTELNDRTIGLVSRIAVSLLDPSYPTRRPAGSFRRSGPSLVIIVNKNDDAIRQEREDGGLMRVWEQLLSSYPLDAKVRFLSP
jgi:GTPase SAR1 family protein